VKPLHWLLCLTTFNHLAFVGARLAVLLYGAHLGASPAVVGLIAALFGLFAAMTSLHAGRWIDRAGPKTPLLVSTVVMVAGCVLPFFWNEIVALIVVATLVGTLHNVFHIAQQQMVGRYGKPEDRAVNFSTSSLANSAASFAGPVIAGFGIDNIGHPLTFLVLAASALVPLPFILLNLIPYPPHTPRKREQAHEAPKGMWSLLKDRALRRIYLVSVLTNGTWSVVTFLVPLYGLQIGLDATSIGTLLGCFSVAAVLVRLLLTMIAGRFSPWQLMVAALFATGTAFLLLPMTANFTLLLVILFWLGLGLGISGPMTQALLYDASPPERTAEVIGMRVTLQNICQTGIPILAGVLGTATGLAPVFWAISALVLWGCYDNRDRIRKVRRT
jgi:MFS family permease